MPGELRSRELIDGTLVVTHIVDDAHDGWRADNYLKSLYRRYSRNQLQNLIDEGRISMKGRRLKPSTTLHPGDRVMLATKKSPADEPDVDLNYGVLYEDDDVIVIDKPGNLPVHPAGRFFFHSLLMQMRKDREDWINKGHNFHLVHRLDRETSGVLVLGKHSESASWLWRQFSDRSTEKRYSAVVHGRCVNDAFTVDADMGSDSNSPIRLKMAAFAKGTGEMEALTHFKVLERAKDVTLLDCELKTGRQHQIRVHLAYVGHPVVGDKLYSGDDQIFLDHISGSELSSDTRQQLKIERHALHSRYLRFFHKVKAKWIEVESPLPRDLKELL